MVVRLRLARFGRKDRAFYRIVAIDSRKPRQGRALEQLGTYNPIASKDGVKEVRLRVDRIKYWMSVGAQPSETVARLLGNAGILPRPPIRYQPIKSVPKADREFSSLSAAASAAAAAVARTGTGAAAGGGGGVSAVGAATPLASIVPGARMFATAGASAPTSSPLAAGMATFWGSSPRIALALARASCGGRRHAGFGGV